MELGCAYSKMSLIGCTYSKYPRKAISKLPYLGNHQCRDKERGGGGGEGRGDDTIIPWRTRAAAYAVGALWSLRPGDTCRRADRQ